jgi:hypothetical protein
MDKAILDWFYTVYVPNVDPYSWSEVGQPSEDELEAELEHSIEFVKAVKRFPVDEDELNDWVYDDEMYDELVNEDQDLGDLT